MLRRYFFVLGAMALPLAIFAQSIVGIGSSTISGEGAVPGDSSWLNLLGSFYNQMGLNVTITNLGWSGSTSFNGMPSSYKMPTADYNDSTPFLFHNITYAWTFNPDIVIVAYPSNDVVLNFTLQQWLSNLRVIYDSVGALGKAAWIATSQPRNDQLTPIRLLLKEARDSILSEFAGHVLDFYDQLADPVTLGFKAGLTDDGIHPNNTGHQLLFQTAMNAGIIPITPLALSVTGFNASWNNGEIDLAWKIAGTGQWTGSSVERSANGVDYVTIWQEPAADATLADQTYADKHPLAGRSFYRIKLAEGAAIHYSPVASLVNANSGWVLERLYPAGNGTQWTLDLSTSTGGQVLIRVVDASGKSVLMQRAVVGSPGRSLSLDLSTLAAGQYFLEVRTIQGSFAARAIQRW